MTYETEIKALLYNCMGCFSKEVIDLYWQNYQQVQLQHSFMNLYVKYA
jgi:hypothetical protein